MAQPELVIGYADADGNIGYQNIVKAPIRRQGDGILPAPGWDGKSDWAGYVPFDELPYDLNPGAGYFGGFNNLAKRTNTTAQRFLLLRAGRPVCRGDEGARGTPDPRRHQAAPA